MKKKKKNANESEFLTCPSKLNMYDVGPHMEPFNSFRSRQFKGGGNKHLQITRRKAEKNGRGVGWGGVDQNGPDRLSLTQANAGQSTVQFTSAHVCVGYREISSGRRWRAGRRVTAASPLLREATWSYKVRSGGGGVRLRSAPSDLLGVDGRWFLNVFDWWKRSSSRPPPEMSSVGRQGRMWILTGSRGERTDGTAKEGNGGADQWTINGE